MLQFGRRPIVGRLSIELDPFRREPLPVEDVEEHRKASSNEFQTRLASSVKQKMLLSKLTASTKRKREEKDGMEESKMETIIQMEPEAEEEEEEVETVEPGGDAEETRSERRASVAKERRKKYADLKIMSGEKV